METVNKAVSEHACIAEPNYGDIDDLTSGTPKFVSVFSWGFGVLSILALGIITVVGNISLYFVVLLVSC